LLFDLKILKNKKCRLFSKSNNCTTLNFTSMKTLGLYNHGDRLEEVDGEGRLPHL
jgi:hypothetical protein